jgi:hypothetical protein
MVADINDKDAAALERLEAERARRLQEKIDSGDVVSQTVTVVCTRDEDVEDACERTLSNLPPLDPDGRPIHYDLLAVVTGVPRGPHLPGQWTAPQVKPASSKGTDHPDEVEAPSGPPLPCSEPVYIRTIVRNGNDEDPGQIIEARYTVEDGAVILRDTDGKFITSRALLNGENPEVLARVLLRERKPNEFQEPIHYPKLGLA